MQTPSTLTADPGDSHPEDAPVDGARGTGRSGSRQERPAEAAIEVNAVSALPPSDEAASPSGSHSHSHSPTLPEESSERDVETAAGTSGVPSQDEEVFDIEHMPVEDDPRKWSSARKWTQVFIVSYGALIPTMGANIFFPALDDLRVELNATPNQISLSVSTYILLQGLIPMLWSPISEIYGRKPCFLTGMALYTLAVGFTSLAPNMSTVIGLRILAAAGSSCTLSIAAGSLADMYEAEERGVVVGVYYSLPITGPAIAPIIGGALTEAAGWKATFWFSAAAGAVSFVLYLLFRETFRVERSGAWQKAKQQAIKKHQKHLQPTASALPASEQDSARAADETGKKLKWFDRRKGTTDGGDEPQQTPEAAVHPPMQVPDYRGADDQLDEKRGGSDGARRPPVRRQLSNRLSRTGSRAAGGRVLTRDGQEITFKPSLKDISPHGSAAYVLSKPHNLAALFYSGINFAAQYALSLTTTQTFTAPPYHFSPILVGCVLLALGVGGMAGSIVGGKLSDRRLRYVAKKIGRKAPPEERLRTVVIPMLCVVPIFAGYGWALEKHANVAVPVVLLFLLGYTQIHSYSSCLAYTVDSNPGRSSGAVATNSAFRGLLAFIASQVSPSILRRVNNGPLDSGWAVIIAVSTVALLVVMHRGSYWRDDAWRWPRFWRREQWRRGRQGGVAWIKQKRLQEEANDAGKGQSVQ
ncbi:unnamed protein product [Parajaminaea phylloscopi]